MVVVLVCCRSQAAASIRILLRNTGSRPKRYNHIIRHLVQQVSEGRGEECVDTRPAQETRNSLLAASDADMREEGEKERGCGMVCRGFAVRVREERQEKRSEGDNN